MVTEHAICALPADHPFWYAYVIRVRRRGSSNDWVLMRGEQYYAGDGDWLPSVGDAFELDEQDALFLAGDLAPTIEVNGLTAADILAR